MMYDDSEHRYRNDPEFHSVVDWLSHMAEKYGFTPGELKQMAFYAAYLVEQRRPPAPTHLHGRSFMMPEPSRMNPPLFNLDDEKEPPK
jgi:hypothetical protein